MEIKRLPQNVREIIRSGENISSVPQCVMELVLNSLDSKANAVAVRINLLTFRIQVVDNGIGVSKSNMKLIGIRYMTSKCHSLKDLMNTKQFGFRGEAFASICQMARKVDIVSKSEGDENTYSKTYENGTWSPVELIKTRPGVGTTVTITEFMHNLPVRQKRIHKSLDLDETKQRLEELAIINCSISFSLRNDATGKIILQSKHTNNVAHALVNFYPYIVIDNLVQVKVSKSKVSVSGLICKTYSTNKKTQFIYLNKRPIDCVKIQKFINCMLSTIMSKSEHPIYCLNIRCPYSTVDLALTPSKTTVEFKNWDVILKCIEKAVKTVLINETSMPNAKNLVDKKKVPSFKSQFGLSQIKGAVTGNKVKRKISASESDDLRSINLDNANPLPSTSYFLKQSKNYERECSRDQIDRKKRKKSNNFNQNTQSLLFSLDNEYNKRVSLFDQTLTTNAVENQDKGKQLIMDVFLKSTVAYPTERSEIITDDVKTVVMEQTTKNKCANTTLAMTVVSKKTILKKSHVSRNVKNHMISKCVQTTMIQQQKMIDFGSEEVPNSPLCINNTLSKYFLTSKNQNKFKVNCNQNGIVCFGSFKKNLVPNFGRFEYFIRPLPSFSQNVDLASIDDVRSRFLYGRNIDNIFPRYQNLLPLHRPRLTTFGNCFNLDCRPLLPKTENCNQICSPYFANNADTKSLKSLHYPTNNLKNLGISPFFKQPNHNFRIKEKPNSAFFLEDSHTLKRRANYVHNSNHDDFFKQISKGRFKDTYKPIGYMDLPIAKKVNKKSFPNIFFQNSKPFNSVSTENTYLHNKCLEKPILPKFKKNYLESKLKIASEKINGKNQKPIRQLSNNLKPSFQTNTINVQKYKIPETVQSNIYNFKRNCSSSNLTKDCGINFKINGNNARTTNNILRSPFFPQPYENFGKKTKLMFFNQSDGKESNNFIPNLQKNVTSFQLNPIENYQFSMFPTKTYQTNTDNLDYDPKTNISVCRILGDLNSEPLFETKATSEIQEASHNLSTSIYFRSSKSPSYSYMPLNPITNEVKEPLRNVFESEKPRAFLDQGSLNVQPKQLSTNSNLNEIVYNFNKHKSNCKRNHLSSFEVPQNLIDSFYLTSEIHTNNFFENNGNDAQLKPFRAPSFLMPNYSKNEHCESLPLSKMKFNMNMNNQNPINNNFWSGTHNPPPPKIEVPIKNTVKQGPTIKKHKSNFHYQKSKLSLKKHASDPTSKLKKTEPLAFQPILPVSIKNATQSTSNVQYKKFKPNLCSTRNEELSPPLNIFESSFNLSQPTHCNGSNFGLTTSTNSLSAAEKNLFAKPDVLEWVQKENEFGNKFYLNSRTGMTSIFSPKEVNKFTLAKRINFLPKGLSPICVENKFVNVSMSTNSKKELHIALMKNFENELQTIKWSNLIDGNTDIKDFFQNLYEQKTKHYENCIPNVSVNTLPRCMIKHFKNAQAQSYSKDLLSNLELIGQWDQKFIIAFSKTKQTLFIFDQHAVSERIRLENLLKDYKVGEKFKGVPYRLNMLNTFSESDLKILEEFKISFENIGIDYTIDSNKVYISHIPNCLYVKYNQEPEHLKNLLISVIGEQIHILSATRGVSANISKTLQNIINSEACRGAIKFGDRLSTSNCEKLVNELNLCKLPFQCAHGRPSVVPLISLEKSSLIEKCKPNLRKLGIWKPGEFKN
ncbi:hypothetical protein RN001_000664 [Aquatica leii]|uniref:DNA mismatch repair protein Mlh3 n=1 Tax=Aquatica leii TaxID=1421715 RepID=A0AAN7PFN3_9COLE|nr:hypothetical protein RN001_000664 [Aquatica leii]